METKKIIEAKCRKNELGINTKRTKKCTLNENKIDINAQVCSEYSDNRIYLNIY